MTNIPAFVPDPLVLTTAIRWSAGTTSRCRRQERRYGEAERR